MMTVRLWAPQLEQGYANELLLIEGKERFVAATKTLMGMN